MRPAIETPQTKPPTIIRADPDGMTADDLKVIIENKSVPTIEVYDPTQEIVDRLDRIARALEEQTLMAREEYRSKGFVIPKKE
jgi:hypothetical protein